MASSPKRRQPDEDAHRSRRTNGHQNTALMRRGREVLWAAATRGLRAAAWGNIRTLGGRRIEVTNDHFVLWGTAACLEI